MQQSIQMITGVLKNMGVDPDSSQLPDSNGCGWLIASDSVAMYVLIEETEGQVLLRLTCPILYMPAHDLLLPFYRKLLDLNVDLIGVALGMERDVVCIICKQYLEGLTPSVAEALLKRTLHTAEVIDDLLVREFPSARYWSPM